MPKLLPPPAFQGKTNMALPVTCRITKESMTVVYSASLLVPGISCTEYTRILSTQVLGTCNVQM